MKKIIAIVLSLVLVIGLAACGTTKEDKVIKVGVVGENNEAWEDVARRFEEDEGVKVELVIFTDYNQPNDALAEGDIQLNAFQHQKFLDNYNNEKGSDLVAIAQTYLAPLGLYSSKVKDVSEVKEGDKIAIPDDPSNGARALFLLQTAGLITIDGKPGDLVTLDAVKDNPLNLEIIPMNSNQTARSLEDVTIAAVNNGMATDAGFSPKQDSIFLEPVDENSDPYINIIAAKAEDKDNELYNKLVKEYFQTDETLTILQEVSKDSFIPAWGTK